MSDSSGPRSANVNPGEVPLHIATAPVNWNNFDLPEWRPKVPFPAILDLMSEAGYRATEYDASFGIGQESLAEAAQARGMSFCGAYQWFDFLDDDAFGHEFGASENLLSLLHHIGCRHLIVADRLRVHRVELAGSVPIDKSASLSGDGYDTIAENVHRLASSAREAGFSLHYHNHVGTYIEAPWELQELLERFDPQFVDLCFDTGHYAYGGGDAAGFLAQHLPDVGYVHLKDVDNRVLENARTNRWSFLDALREYVFCPLGEGSADIEQIVQTLRGSTFSHPVVIEQDTCKGDSTVNARQNRNFLVS